jgi:hypothetical protein
MKNINLLTLKGWQHSSIDACGSTRPFSEIDATYAINPLKTQGFMK